jgi:hypothetical protein
VFKLPQGLDKKWAANEAEAKALIISALDPEVRRSIKEYRMWQERISSRRPDLRVGAYMCQLE